MAQRNSTSGSLMIMSFAISSGCVFGSVWMCAYMHVIILTVNMIRLLSEDV